MTKIIKQYRVLYRSADGGATYLAVTGEGSELLMIRPVGSRWSSVIEGVDLDQAWGIKDVTVIDVEPFEDPLRAIDQFIEPPAEHTPADLVVDEPVEAVVDDDDRAEVFVDESVEPEFPAVDPAVEEAALSIASQVQSVGSLPRDQLSKDESEHRGSVFGARRGHGVVDHCRWSGALRCGGPSATGRDVDP